MGQLVTDFAGKSSGELIKAADWNGLIAGIESAIGALAKEVAEGFDQANARLDGLDGRLSQAETDIQSMQGVVEAVRSRYRHLTLEASATRFAIGQRGLITARVTDVEGNPLDLSNAQTRPWVDFVTVWGTLKPEAGFVSRGGAGDQTVSVQVNAQGEARVRIRSDHAEAFAEEDEREVEAVLDTRVSGTSLAERFLSAQTPRSSGVSDAYQVISKEYDRTDALVMRKYVDAYYVTKPARIIGDFTTTFHHRWRDYRATVMAFVKPDSDPLSPDGAQAAGTIQVTFRDWITPWIVTDYLPGSGGLRADYINRFRGRIGPKFDESLRNLTQEVSDIVRGKGVLAKQRDFIAIGEAIGQVGFTDPPPFMNELVNSVKGGAVMQQSVLYGQVVNPGIADDASAFEVVASSSGKATAAAQKVERDLTSFVEKELGTASALLKNEVRVEQAAFREELLRDDGPINSVQRSILAVTGEVQTFREVLNTKADVSLITRIVGTSG